MSLILGQANFMYAEKTDIVNHRGEQLYKVIYYKDDEKELSEYMTKANIKAFGDKLKLVADAIKAIPK